MKNTMVRTFSKQTGLGTIEREMRFSDDGLYIHLYTVFPLKGTETYDGTIERQYEHAQAVEWKDFGFKEVL